MFTIKEIPFTFPEKLVGSHAFNMGECFILTSIDDGKFHLSISHEKRYPTWDEIKFARYSLCPPNKTMAMLFPPKEFYVNIHQNCFHLYEL